jgi:hypothetical protein
MDSSHASRLGEFKSGWGISVLRRDRVTAIEIELVRGAAELSMIEPGGWRVLLGRKAIDGVVAQF